MSTNRTDAHTYTDRRDRTHYHAALISSNMMILVMLLLMMMMMMMMMMMIVKNRNLEKFPGQNPTHSLQGRS